MDQSSVQNTLPLRFSVLSSLMLFLSISMTAYAEAESADLTQKSIPSLTEETAVLNTEQISALTVNVPVPSADAAADCEYYRDGESIKLSQIGYDSSINIMQYEGEDRRRIRVAVLQAGRSEAQRRIFVSLVANLKNFGLLKTEKDISPDFDFSSKRYYEALASSAKGGSILLLEDGLFCGYGNKTLTEYAFSSLKRRIEEKKDIDMIWVFGEEAARFAAENISEVPVLIMGVSADEADSLSGKGEFSQRKNIHVQKERGRFDRELKVFHDAFKFETLGIIADRNMKRQSESGLKSLQKSAEKLGFRAVMCYGDIEQDFRRQKQISLRRCAAQLSKSVDAVYICEGNAVNDGFFDSVSVLIKRGIPVFSQAGSAEVERGALMSMTDENRNAAGFFAADTVRRIFEGAKTEELSQYFSVTFELSVNLYTAGLLEWKPDTHILFAADRVYDKIRHYQDIGSL